MKENQENKSDKKLKALRLNLKLSPDKFISKVDFLYTV